MPTGSRIARDAGFRKLVAAGLTQATSAELPPVVPGTYYWRAASKDAAGRVGEVGVGARLFVEPVTEDRLLGPEDGAELKVATKSAAITFTWRVDSEARSYRLVLARGADLSSSARVERTTGGRLEVEAVPLGTWYWGVWAEGASGSAGGRPLFAKPYKLTLKLGKSTVAPRIEAPTTIEWN
ncbi:MAG: hypothetical protein QM765_17905 [Myxococcales bacterium]